MYVSCLGKIAKQLLVNPEWKNNMVMNALGLKVAELEGEGEIH